MTDIKYWDWAQFTKSAAEIRNQWEADVRKEFESLFEEWTNPELGEPHE